MKLIKTNEFKFFILSLIISFGLLISQVAFFTHLNAQDFYKGKDSIFGTLSTISVLILPLEVALIVSILGRKVKMSVLRKTLFIWLGGMIPGIPSVILIVLPAIYFLEVWLTVYLFERFQSRKF